MCRRMEVLFKRSQAPVSYIFINFANGELSVLPISGDTPNDASYFNATEGCFFSVGTLCTAANKTKHRASCCSSSNVLSIEFKLTAMDFDVASSLILSVAMCQLIYFIFYSTFFYNIKQWACCESQSHDILFLAGSTYLARSTVFIYLFIFLIFFSDRQSYLTVIIGTVTVGIYANLTAQKI